MPTTQNISWLRLFTEATAIVLSILAAFMIDAWWDDAQQRKHLETVLASLEAGFRENIVLIDHNIDYVNADRNRVQRFIDMTPGEAQEIPPEHAFSFLEAIWRPGTNESNNSLLISTLDAENINLLGDSALQAAIARWRTQIDELDERAGQLATNEGDALLALGRHPQIGVALAHADDENFGYLSGDTMRRAREDNELMAIAARKAFQGQIHLQTLRRQREQAEAVIGLIQIAQNRMR